MAALQLVFMQQSCGQLWQTVKYVAGIVAILSVAGCGKPATQVVVYCALDREYSEPILRRFEEETGIHVLASYDAESTKSVGLAERIEREKTRPRCDVFWNNEILNTIRLARDGVLTRVDSPVGAQYPAKHHSPDNLWFAFAARARVLLVNSDQVESAVEPKTLEDLALPRWRGRIGIAKPLFGTTATHVACLFATLGPDRARHLLRSLKENDLKILPGNRHVAQQVASGGLAMGLTDTDDALAEIRARRPVRMVFLDCRAGEFGVTLIPNTVALIASAPHPAEAARLIDYLLSPEIEKELALGPSGQIPLNPATAAKPGLGLPENCVFSQVDFEKAATAWDEAMRFVKEEFTGP